jgi:GT2 family glycosyltransferase
LLRRDLRTEGSGIAEVQGFEGFLPGLGEQHGTLELLVTARLADQIVRRWTVAVHVQQEAAQYATWLERIQTAAPTRLANPPLVTWLVQGPDGPARTRTLASLRAASAICANGPDAPVTTPWIGVISAGDELRTASYRALEQVLRSRAEPRLIFADHDQSGPDGLATDPVLKPSWSPLDSASAQTWGSGWLVHQSLLNDQPLHDRLTDRPDKAMLRRARGAIHHLPWPLTSRAGPAATAPPPCRLPTSTRPKVTVIVPTRLADLGMLQRCLDTLTAEAAEVDLDVVIVLNNQASADQQSAESMIQAAGAKTLEFKGSFNWSALNNLGAKGARGEWLLFMNDDVEATARGWLAAMLTTAAKPGVGCVGALLRYPDGSIQHAGVWLDGRSRWAGRHTFRHASGHERRVAQWLSTDRERTAVTGACMLTTKVLFESCGGFDTQLPVVFNDVDFCLRLRQSGWRSVVSAGAQLIHHESVSRGGIPEQADHDRFYARWHRLLPTIDPFWHPCLDGELDTWSLDGKCVPPLDVRP